MGSGTETILVTGATGFLGRHVVKALEGAGYCPIGLGSRDCDLTDANQVADCIDAYNPETVVHLAALCGGIGFNKASPGDLIADNLAMGLNLCRYTNPSVRFIMVGTVCSYPKHCPVPFVEADLWNGYPEETNAPYGIAKKAIGELLAAEHRETGRRYSYPILANLYGPGDNFDLHTSHVIPAMVRRFVEAVELGVDEVVLWGSGTATRDFLYVEDAAKAITMLVESERDYAPLNIGTGVETSISYLSAEIAARCGYTGRIVWDANQPDGQPRRVLDTTKARDLLGWGCSVPLPDGLDRTVEWYRKNRFTDRNGAV